MKNAAILVDERDTTKDLLSFWSMNVTEFSSPNALLGSDDAFDLVIVRAGEDGWRLEYVPQIRSRWNDAKIIVISGGNYEQMALANGADAFSHSTKPAEELKALLKGYHLVE